MVMLLVGEEWRRGAARRCSWRRAEKGVEARKPAEERRCPMQNVESDSLKDYTAEEAGACGSPSGRAWLSLEEGSEGGSGIARACKVFRRGGRESSRVKARSPLFPPRSSPPKEKSRPKPSSCRQDPTSLQHRLPDTDRHPSLHPSIRLYRSLMDLENRWVWPNALTSDGANSIDTPTSTAAWSLYRPRARSSALRRSRDDKTRPAQAVIHLPLYREVS